MAKKHCKQPVTRLKGGLVVTADKILKSDVIIRNGRLELANTEPAEDEHIVDITGKYILAGFIDIHFHGHNLFEFTAGLYDSTTGKFDDSWLAYEYGLDMLRQNLASFGVTNFYVGTWAAGLEKLNTCFSHLSRYMTANNNSAAGAELVGGLLEGSFINPEMAGAQNPDFVFEQSPQLFDAIEDGGTIKLVNVVPDFGKKSCKLIEYLTGRGIVVGAGHTNATCQQVVDAVKAGLKYIIHFTNGPTGGSYKPFNGGGTIEAVLKSDELYAEQILDGCHVNPAYVRDILKRKGANRIIAITDALFVTGSSLKTFNINGIKGRVSDDGRYICLVDDPLTLCSSNLTMDRAFENLLNWLTSRMEGIWNRSHPVIDIDDALVTASAICSTNAAVLTGLAEDGTGSITDGAKANLCILDINGSAGDYTVTVDKTIVNGHIVYSENSGEVC